jgi:Fe(II)/alpha-ketoglutarate-dependent arginine beta-hydroxylase
MDEIRLTPSENETIHSLLDGLAAEYKSEEDPRFLRYAPVYAHELPERLRFFMMDFKFSEDSSGLCLISGYSLDDNKIGRTPAHWRARPELSRTLTEDMLLIMYGSLLGEVFGWATEQNGHIVHDVFPIEENENIQISTGSQQAIWWHTEDAFHPYSGDYVGLMCLRNPDNVATTYAIVNSLNLSEDEIRILFEPRFVIRPDASHTESPLDLQNDFRDIPEHLCGPAQHRRNGRPKISVLFGSPACPFIRIDPYYMDPLEEDEQVRVRWPH